MNRILSSLLTAAFVVSLAGAAGATSSMKGHAMMGGHHMGMMHKCAKGKMWVHGYMKKDGTRVKGYCRA